jgi:hypothetical protein
LKKLSKNSSKLVLVEDGQGTGWIVHLKKANKIKSQPVYLQKNKPSYTPALIPSAPQYSD